MLYKLTIKPYIKPFIAFLLIGIAQTSLAQSDRWVYVGDGETAVFFIDTRTIKVDRHLRRFWTKINYKQKDKFGDLSHLVQQEIDCNNSTRRVLAHSIYKQLDNMGPSEHMPVNAQILEPISPDSVGETFLEFACKIRVSSPQR